jgi:ABC-2 type transport system ATP-binding protein
MIVLRVEKVKKSFRGEMSLAKREVLHGVSLHLSSGEIMGFLGPNGAGKTTTIKIMLGLVRPDSGEVRILERPAGDRSAMARVGYLPENPYFYPHLSLDEFLGFCGQMSGMGRDGMQRRISDVIELVGLIQHRGQRIKGFSKGMLQRTGLAQAILHKPDLLILDEPFSGLDPLGRIMVRDLLLEMKRRGTTIFFSSHILPDMEALCDSTCIIREGVIVRHLGLDELIRLGEGKIEVTARDCGDDAVEAVREYIEARSDTGEETFLVVKKQEFLRTVIQALYNHGSEILRVETKHPSLEEVFLSEISGRKKKKYTGGSERESTVSRKGVHAR